MRADALPIQPTVGPRQSITATAFVLGVIVVVSALASPFQAHLVAQVLIYAVGLVGLNLLSGVADELSLGHAGVLAVGAYTSAILVLHADWLVFPSIIMAIVAGAAAGGVLWYLGTRVLGLLFAIITLAFNVIVITVVNRTEQFTGAEDGLASIPQFLSIEGSELNTKVSVAVVALVLLIAMVGYLQLMASPWGVALRAVAHDHGVASATGLNPSRVRLLAHVAAGSLGGLSGALYAHYSSFISPNIFSTDKSILLILALLLVGLGDHWSPLVGAMFIVYVPFWLGRFSEFQPLLWGVALIVVVVVFPRGAAPAIRNAYPRIKQAVRSGTA